MKIDAFIEALEAQTQSKETLRAYRQDLERFEAFLSKKGLRSNQVKPQILSEYISYLRSNHGRIIGVALSPATIDRRLSVVKRYYDWVNENSRNSVRNPVLHVRRPKVRNQMPRAVNDCDLAKLVEGTIVTRDRAIILLFIYSGLRLSELHQLNKDTLVLRRRQKPDGSYDYYGTGEVIGKGGKRRQFIVGPKAMATLGKYIAADRREDPFPALFISSRNTRLSCRAIQQIIGKWCKRLGLDAYHVHQLRHSFATRNVNAGMSPAVLQELMGHSSLDVTQRYFKVHQERIAQEYHAAMEYIAQILNT
jgi:site-specific recombinase XerD